MSIVSLDPTLRLAVDSKAMEEKSLAFEVLPSVVEAFVGSGVGHPMEGWLEGVVDACLGTVEFMWEPGARLVSRKEGSRFV